MLHGKPYNPTENSSIQYYRSDDMLRVQKWRRKGEVTETVNLSDENEALPSLV